MTTPTGPGAEVVTDGENARRGVVASASTATVPTAATPPRPEVPEGEAPPSTAVDPTTTPAAPGPEPDATTASAPADDDLLADAARTAVATVAAATTAFFPTPPTAPTLPGTRSAGPPTDPRPGFVEELEGALADVESVRLALDVPGAAAARALRDRLTVQIRTHLVPRSQGTELPAVVVLGGSTGAGKSTLLNSLLGEEVSAADVLRPTTRTPVLAVHPDDAATMRTHPIAAVVEVVEHEAVPPGLALVDTPDLDSVDADNRRLAAHLVEVADLWLFITTATRYGDALPWTTLTAARERGVTIAVVLNRVTARAAGVVRGDLLDRLADDGLGDAPLFVVPDVGPHEGRLPEAKVGELARWLQLLASSAAAQRVASRTIRGGWPSVRADLTSLAEAVHRQAEAARALAALTSTTIEAHVKATSATLLAGDAASGAVSATAQERLQRGAPLAVLLDRQARVPTRRGAPAARAAAAEAVGAVVQDALGASLTHLARAAEQGVRGAWVAGGAGASPLLARLDRESVTRTRDARVTAAVRAWADGAVSAVAAVPTAPGEVERAARLLDPYGWAPLVCAAALGAPAVPPALEATWGEAGRAFVADARADVVRRAVDVVRAEVVPFLDALASVDDDAAAAALRGRARALEDLT